MIKGFPLLNIPIGFFVVSARTFRRAVKRQFITDCWPPSQRLHSWNSNGSWLQKLQVFGVFGTTGYYGWGMDGYGLALALIHPTKIVMIRPASLRIENRPMQWSRYERHQSPPLPAVVTDWEIPDSLRSICEIFTKQDVGWFDEPIRNKVSQRYADEHPKYKYNIGWCWMLVELLISGLYILTGSYPTSI